MKKKVGKAAQSIGVALRSVWSAEKIERMTTHLKEIREQMMLAVLIIIWLVKFLLLKLQANRLCRTRTSKEGQGAAHIASIQEEMLQSLEKIDSRTRDFSKEVAVLIRNDQMTYESQRKVNHMIGIVWDSKLVPEPIPSTDNDNLQERNIALITNSLLFERIGSRESQISPAHSETFHWIFDQPPCKGAGAQQLQWSSYLNWLASESKEIYWICGKPGSGKSTLVKYILSQGTLLHAHLRGWSGDSSNIVAGFYSWNAGTDLQRSHEGLLRTLLYQILAAKPDLISTVCPRRLVLLQIFGGEAMLPHWTIEELHNAFTKILSLARTSLRLIIFIDGLDEFEEDHSTLVDFLRDTSAYEGVKVCVSSHPWNLFADTFKKTPKLKLEDLTRSDINSYVRHEFSLSEGFCELERAQPEKATALKNDIVSKAQGVFLWVSLVVRSLLISLRDGDRIDKLRKILDDLPDDLSKLFDRMWNRIGEIYHHETSQYFQVLEAVKNLGVSLSIRTLWLTDEEYPVIFDMANLSKEAISDRAIVIKRRLNSRTMGLINIYADGQVDYLHRTTREWALESWTMILAKAPATFDFHLVLLKALATEIMLGTSQAEHIDLDYYGLIETFWDCVSVLFKCASLIRDESENVSRVMKVLDQIDSLLTQLLNADKPRLEHWSFACSLKDTPDDMLPCFQRVRYENAPANEPWMLAFAAFVPVSPFVRGKLLGKLENIDTLQLQQLYVDGAYSRRKPLLNLMLENAVFGFDISSDHPNGLKGFICRYDQERVDLVQFMLQHCVFSESCKVLLLHRVSQERELRFRQRGIDYQVAYFDSVLEILRPYVVTIASQKKAEEIVLQSDSSKPNKMKRVWNGVKRRFGS